MNISDAAKKSGVSDKLIRHYESIGLIPKATRSHSGYRIYRDADVHILSFVKRARKLGFSMKEIQRLIGLWKNKSRASKEVKNLALAHLKDLDTKISELQGMANALRHLSSNCQGDDRPECPILTDLEEKGSKK